MLRCPDERTFIDQCLGITADLLWEGGFSKRAAAGVGRGPRARSRRCSLVIWTSGEAAICWLWLYKSFQELQDRKKERKYKERAPGIALWTSGTSKTSNHLPRSFASLVSVLPSLLSLSVESGLMLRPPLSKCPQRVLP